MPSQHLSWITATLHFTVKLIKNAFACFLVGRETASPQSWISSTCSLLILAWFYYISCLLIEISTCVCHFYVFYHNCQKLKHFSDFQNNAYSPLGLLTPSFPFWSVFTPLVCNCGRPGLCNMCAARMVRRLIKKKNNKKNGIISVHTGCLLSY